MMNENTDDPINDSRTMLWPMSTRQQEVFTEYKKMLSLFWVEEEVDVSKDREHWEKLQDSGIKNMIRCVLSFFAVADKLIMDNLGDNFMEQITAPECNQWYAAQECNEAVHNEMYQKLLLTMMPDEYFSIEQLLNNFKSVKAKQSFCTKYMDSTLPFHTRIVAFACVEGLLFQASFCAIYWLKQTNLFPGLTKSNEFIARDEAVHCHVATLIHNRLDERCPSKLIVQIVKEAVKIEKVFIKESLKGVDGLNPDDVEVYVECLADLLLAKLGVRAVFQQKMPTSLGFMTALSLDSKTNFFEERVSEYQKYKPEAAGSFSSDMEDF